MTLPAGTVLFHGTDNDDFDESNDRLEGPAWVSTSKSVAAHFASRSGGWGGVKRVISYTLADALSLPEITSRADMLELSEEHDICLGGAEEIRESFQASELPGWIIPNNYPDGDDILIVDTSLLDYVGVELLPTIANETEMSMGCP
jgi:hypothetical protein